MEENKDNKKMNGHKCDYRKLESVSRCPECGQVHPFEKKSDTND